MSVDQDGAFLLTVDLPLPLTRFQPAGFNEFKNVGFDQFQLIIVDVHLEVDFSLRFRDVESHHDVLHLRLFCIDIGDRAPEVDVLGLLSFVILFVNGDKDSAVSDVLRPQRGRNGVVCIIEQFVLLERVACDVAARVEAVPHL